MGNLTAKVALRRAYDLDNNIYTDAVDAKEPFSLIMMHQPEQAANRGKWDDLMNKYRIHQIREYFNFNFTEWVNQPNDIVEKQISASIKWRESELSEKDKITLAMEEELKRQGMTVPPPKP